MIYKFIKVKGCDSDKIGYFTPRMYKMPFIWKELKVVGLSFVKERLTGWTIWFVENEDDFNRAIKALDELKKTRKFVYMVSR